MLSLVKLTSIVGIVCNSWERGFRQHCHARADDTESKRECHIDGVGGSVVAGPILELGTAWSQNRALREDYFAPAALISVEKWIVSAVAGLPIADSGHGDIDEKSNTRRQSPHYSDCYPARGRIEQAESPAAESLAIAYLLYAP